MAWVEKHVAKPGQLVRGAIIASTISEDLRLACSRIDGVALYEYRLSVSLMKVPTDSAEVTEVRETIAASA